jgi:hypothetical protein
MAQLVGALRYKLEGHGFDLWSSGHIVVAMVT